ncbi:MAG: LamG domain-containing protein [Planctomycetes bacterium]|nr:LamG domain-containing protein [Planctomycetota bacterium]
MRSLLVATILLATTIPAQNQGLSLANGTTAYVDAPFSPNLVPTGGLTAEAWVTYGATALGSGWRFPTVFRMDPSPNQASYFLRIEAGQTQSNRLLWWVSTTNGDYSITWTFAAGTLIPWTHVAGSYDGTTLRLFVNGAQVAQGNGTGPIQNRGGVFRIGNGDVSITGGETWNGDIDEVRVWPFARSAAAIASTMNMRLQSMPGEVTTWNLDGDGLDSSGQNHGTAIGSPTFVTNTRTEQVVPFPGALNLGAPTGCRTDGLAAIAAIANVGNGGFGFVGTRAPANAGGFALLSMGALPAPLQVLGIDVLVNPNLGASLFVLANSLGTATLGFAIPNDVGYLGQGFYTQFLWLDGTCANGVSASNAVFASILP